MVLPQPVEQRAIGRSVEGHDAESADVGVPGTMAEGPAGAGGWTGRGRRGVSKGHCRDLFQPHPRGSIIGAPSATVTSTLGPLATLRKLVDMGVTHELDQAMQKRIRLTNAVSLFGVFIMLASLPFDRVSAPRWMLAEDVLGAVAYLGFPLLNRRGLRSTARLLCLALSNLIVLSNAILLGRDSGASMVFIALAAMPFALFDLRDRAAVAAGVGLAVACFVVAESDLLAAYRSVSENYSPRAYHIYSAAVTLAGLLFILVQTQRANARAERELAENREHYRLVTEAASDAIVTIDEQDQIVFASPATVAMFGYPLRELYGRSLSLLLTSFQTDRATASAAGEGQRRDGSTFPAEISFGHLQHGARKIRTAVVRDVSDRVEAARALDQSRQAAIHTAKLAALGEMSGNIAHEVNNPLTAILLRAQRLLRLAEGEDGRLDRALVAGTGREIEKTVQRIARIVDALRSFARDVEQDPTRPESVHQIVADTVELCAQRFQQHAIALEVDPIAPDLVVECRSVQISQVVLNLLGNAHDAVEGGATRWVRLSAAAGPRPEEVEIAVTDSGPGVPAELQGRIMEPFFTTKPMGKGTGLGLSVSKGIAEAHGGRLVHDLTSRATRFVLVLRRRIPPG
jgi:PAS domain S-box-containing protein